MKPNEIFVRMLAAPITSLDLSQIAGYAGKAASFPRVAGNEGVGIVEEVGSGVKGVKKGDHVVASRSGAGTWATHTISDADAWTVVPPSATAAVGSEAFPVEHAAVSVVAPLTGKLLVESAALAKGDVIVQNNAFSTVGQAVVQYAAAAGIHTVNIARKRDDWANHVYHLQGLGAGVVVDEDFARTPAFAKTLADLPGPKAGFNSVGGVSGGVVAKALGAGASFVTYGSASRQAVRLPASLFTGKGLVARGFNLEAALAGKPKAARDAAVQAAIADVRGTPKEAKVKLLLAREPFADFGAALKRATTRGQRKVVLVMPTA